MAQKYLKYLMISYEFQVGLGLLAAIIGSFIVAVMATDAPNSTVLHFLIGGFIGFFGILLFTALLPSLAHQELKKYELKKNLFFNYIYVVVATISCFPLGIWHAYMIYKIKKYLDEDVKHLEDTKESPGGSMIGIYAMLAFASLMMASALASRLR